MHSTVKERWARQDPVLVSGMQLLASYAAEGVQCLQQQNYSRLAELMNANFALRRQLYSDEVVGLANIHVAETLHGLNLACKFTGSGGAFLVLRQDGNQREW